MPIDELASSIKNNKCSIDINDTIDSEKPSLTTNDNENGNTRRSNRSVSVGNASQHSDNHLEVDEVHHTHHEHTGLDKFECPATICVTNSIGAVRSRRLLRVLLDSGSSTCLIKRSALPKGIQPQELAQSKSLKTLAGTVMSTQVVTLRDIRLPEFDKNRKIAQQRALVFDSPTITYDVILGTNFLSKTGIKLNYEKGQMEWFDCIIPMRPTKGLTDADFHAMEDNWYIQVEESLLGEDWLQCYANEILDAKYEWTSVKDVVNGLDHLNQSQRDDILKVLEKHASMFDGTLGVYPHKKFHIDVDPTAKPVHARPYAIPRIHLQTFKKELDHLVRIGVLVRQQESEWASPTFIIPKKDGRVRWISDLRQLNKVIKRRQYPLPVITDILRKRVGYEFFTKLDISMQYYTFELDDESQDLCTISTPFGKYKYTRLPMGLKCSPDFAQATMENVLRDINDADVYIDDVGAFSDTWESHVQLLDIILRRLRENGFTINPLKCEWAVKETDWLGYWLTPRGLKPWRKKIDAILNMDRPRNATELRMFIGAVNFYRDMWPSRAHVLKPLTDMSGLKKKQPINWTDEMQIAFDKIRKLIAADALAAYPNHNERFDVYTDSSDFQLGACIMQSGRPVAYFSRKLSAAQRNYTTMEKEMLSIVATLDEFRSMLLGANIHVFTDHKNLTFDSIKTQRVLRWRNRIEEFSPILHYIQGPKNILADNLSRLHRLVTPAQLAEGKNLIDPATVSDEEDAFIVEQSYTGLHDTEVRESIECYLNLPDDDHPEQNPLNYDYIREQQQDDDRLLALHQRYPHNYFYKSLSDDVDDILCYVKDHNNPDSKWKIALPETMIEQTIHWFHRLLGHPGQKRLRETLRQRYHHPRMRYHINRF